jgi:hypothetical protein
MKSDIKFYRVILNILFFIFYILLASIIFSFTFPSILVLLWKDVLSPTDPIFDKIQIVILVLVPVFTLIFRKYFYLPIMDKYSIWKSESKKEIIKEKLKDKKINKVEEIKYEEKIVKKDEKKQEIIDKDDNSPKLDIKIGKEIK